MSRDEFQRLASALRSYWPKEKLLPTKESMELWYQELKDLDYELAVSSVRKYVQTNKWAPTIAEIRAQAVDIQADGTDWGDGWEEVLRAIRRHGMYDEEGALDSMSPMTREIVKRLGWKQICQSEQDEMMAVRANFRMMFEQKDEKERKEAALSTELKSRIAQLLGGEVKQIGG